MSMRTAREPQGTNRTGWATYGMVNDENTGLHSTGADQCQLQTGGTAALTVSSSQVVNIPADKFTNGGNIAPDYIYLTVDMAVASQMTTRSIMTAPRAMQLVGVTLAYGVVAGQACAVQIEKCTTTTAPGSGTALLTNNTNSGFDATATANTPQTGTLTGTTASLQFAAGDRLSMKWGTSTSCVGAVLTFLFKPI